MADFTAVIRRAVDGLPEQSPELRARVYEKARSAVIRQMENMSPPPPEALIKRQIDKIDAAIAEVEGEFAVALPPDDSDPLEDLVSDGTQSAGEDIPEARPRQEWGAEQEDVSDDEAAEQDAPENTPASDHVPADSYHADDDDGSEDVRIHGHDDVLPQTDEEVAQFEDHHDRDREPVDEAPSSPRSLLQGATFELVSTPDRVYREDQADDQDDAYTYDVTDEPVETDAGTVVVEPDEKQHHHWQADEDEPATAPEDWEFESTTAKAGGFDPAPPPPSRSVPEKDWAHVDSLLGLEPEAPGSGFEEYDEAGGNAFDRRDDEAGGHQKRRIAVIAGAVVVALILVVGGYFAWGNRDRIIAAISPADQEQATTEPTATPEQTDAQDTQDVAETTKPYTQRLLPDGTEVDEGLPDAGTVSGPARSVANQTSASTPAETASATQTVDPSPPVGAVQKMYLYEEQLGQSVPSAFQGTVEWELKQENNGTAVSEPVVEGVMNVPDAGLSGVLTFRRNDDPSLPASHLIDISFTLADDFDGGAIDNVQRVSLKGTEAARGDPLIAVSAKITDDLYMLALNDFDQARSQNLSLLGDRNWIDIPVTYRNGRRALLTLEKGTTGMAIFDRAIQEWQALGDINSAN